MAGTRVSSQHEGIAPVADTLVFPCMWEQLHNPGFNSVEFDEIKMQASLNSFTLTSKQWIEKTGAIHQMQTPTSRSLKQLGGDAK